MAAEPATGSLGTFRRAARHPSAVPLGLAAAGLAGAAYLYRTDPHRPGQLLPRCPFEFVTGLWCPACGGTRMTYDLMHGDVAAAFHDNAVLLLLGVPAAAYLWTRQVQEAARGRRYRPAPGRRGVAVVLGTAVAWTVARNVMGWGPA
ncbi:DUF2752 domain-containing protein [Streptomyces sp. TR06-5]|uniref:DUF2752 domain-containing protein n=1 Tax=unclassified Streptomyces TaxID=2593676 RepID=UPI0039A16BEE